MAYASRAGRARTNPSNPRAFAVCQRCGIWSNHCDLQWQAQWGGASLINTRLLVCRQCLDVPQQQLRALALSADPVPVKFALTEPFAYDETSVGAPVGAPVGLDQNAVMPLFGTKHYGVLLPVLSVTANGTTTIAVTCSAAHGLATNDQIAVDGLAAPKATGFFSVTVTTATAFTYATFAAIPTGALLTAATRIVTALVGLPYGVTQIPQVGP